METLTDVMPRTASADYFTFSHDYVMIQNLQSVFITTLFQLERYVTENGSDQKHPKIQCFCVSVHMSTDSVLPCLWFHVVFFCSFFDYYKMLHICKLF